VRICTHILQEDNTAISFVFNLSKNPLQDSIRLSVFFQALYSRIMSQQHIRLSESADVIKEGPTMTSAAERPNSSESENEKLPDAQSLEIEDREEPVPHLHAKTFLTIFAVCLIYIAQLINVVGAGAVSYTFSFLNITVLLTPTSRELKTLLRLSEGVAKQSGLLPPSPS
jgi:hypothetical protein